MTRQLYYRLLGPLEVARGGELLELGAAKQRAVLAILLLEADRAVSTDQLIEHLWPERAPGRPKTAIQGYVSGLRKILGAGVIETVAGGYALRAAQDRLDLYRFEQLFSDAHALRSGDPAAAAKTYRQALDLWRGRPLADFTYESFAQQAINRLEGLQLACLEGRIEADLACGRHAELIGELEVLAREHPLRERLHGQLMLALYRSGRQAEALDAYRHVRRQLVDELGIEPTPALQQLERDILMQEPTLDLAPAEQELPQGRVTFLMSDVEGSTRLLEELGERYPKVLAEHRRLLRSACEACGGREVDRQGDNLFLVFERAPDAVAGALAAQRALAAASWPGGVSVHVRMGMHTGEATIADGGYVGIDVHRTARICAVAHGGQVLVSAETRGHLPETGPHAVGLRDLGEYAFEDLAERERLFQLVAPGLPADFPPPRAVEAVPALVRPERSILLVPSSGDVTPLLEVAEPLARSHHPHELILARLLDASGAGVADGELAQASGELRRLRDSLARRGVAARAAAFTSPDVADDLVRLASEQEVDLVLLDLDVGQVVEKLAPQLHVLLADAPSDVALLVNRNRIPHDGPVLVPFGGAEHDWAALELAAWLASAHEATLWLLGVEGDRSTGRRDASRLLATASLAVQQLVGVAAEPLLAPPGANGILGAAEGAAFLIVGLSSDWQREGLGTVRGELARSAAAPTLLVRRGLRPGGLAPRESLTRFTWSLSEARSPA